MSEKEYTGITRVAGGDRDKALSAPVADPIKATGQVTPQVAPEVTPEVTEKAADIPRKESPKK